MTGSEGLLGSTFCQYSSIGEIRGFSKERLDITSALSVEKILSAERPDIILHTAAFTNVEACEMYPEKAYSINVVGTENLVSYCKKNKVLLIYISSTGVYGSGKNSAYIESDIPKPTTMHHKTKYQAEQLIMRTLKDYLILRTGWLYGATKLHSKNFVYNRFMEAKYKDVIFSDSGQSGNPTFVMDLVGQIDLLITENLFGTFNCVNSGENVTRYNYVHEIIKNFGLNCEVKPGDSSLFARVAPVSKNESAINAKLNQLDLNTMGDWKEALSRYIESIK